MKYRLAQNMQGLLSYGRLQDWAMKSRSDIISGITENIPFSTNGLQASEERLLHLKEYLGLVEQLGSIQNTVFNNIKLLGNGYGVEKQQSPDSLKNNRPKPSKDLVKDKHNLNPVTTDSWELTVKGNRPFGGPAAFVSSSVITSSGAYQHKAGIQKTTFDLPDSSAPHAPPQSRADGVVSYKMVSLIQAQHSYFGDPQKCDTWFKGGLTEFIRSADSRVNSHLLSGSTPPSLVGEISVDLNRSGSSEEFAACFLTISYMHEKIVDAGMSDATKHMTMWFCDQFQDPNKNAATSSINAYFGAHSSIGHIGNRNFLNNFTSEGGGQALSSNLNSRSYSIGCIGVSDISGNPADEKTPQTFVPYTNGVPQRIYAEEDPGEPVIFSYPGCGDTATLTPLPPASFGDTTTYNPTTNKSASLALEQSEPLPQSAAWNRAVIRSDMSIIQNGLDSLRERTTTLSQSISSTQDSSLAEDGEDRAIITKASLMLKYSLPIFSQARQSSASLTPTLLS